MEDGIIYYLIVNKKDIITDSIKETDMALLVLKHMLNHFNIEMPVIERTSTNKPYFKDSNIFFNYSHSKNYIPRT